MSNAMKNQKGILEKLKIEKLNPMQEEAKLAIHSASDIMILSPTGSGKTLGFLLPIVAELDITCAEVQAMIIVPSRELAIQIEQVAREMGTGYKVNCVYGGRSFSKDKYDLQHPPAILVGTPGRVADHLRRKTFKANEVKILVLDEFDKSLEVGFETEMKDIISLVRKVEKRILTSATQGVEVPDFVRLTNPIIIDYLGEGKSELKIKTVLSPDKDKLQTLVDTLSHIGNQPGIIFCNFKETIQRVSDYLTKNNISHGCFYGGLEQKDRERALIKFRNGTHQVLLATDLAARGLDITELKFIIHYHLPIKSEEFTHRNGRTARMHSEGTAYVLKWKNEELPDFIQCDAEEKLEKNSVPQKSDWSTLLISGGRQDKISKGDIAGLFFKQGNLKKDELGVIELKQDCAFAAVPSSRVNHLIKYLDNTRVKKRKIRVTLI